MQSRLALDIFAAQSLGYRFSGISVGKMSINSLMAKPGSEAAQSSSDWRSQLSSGWIITCNRVMVLPV
jgi:hypothetical protein